MAQYVAIAAIDAVLNGSEITLPATYVALQDFATGFDGPGSYHVQLVSGGSLLGGPGYRVTYGTPPPDTYGAMTVLRVVLTPTGVQFLKDARKLNVGNTGVNATILQTANADGSYLKSGVVTQRTLASGITLPVGHGTSFPGSPLAYQLFYRDDLEALFVWNGSAWQSSDSLQQLNDVDITSPSNGQVLQYDAGASKWINATPSGGGGSGSSITFSATATGTNWNPQGHTPSSYFKSLSSFTPPSTPYLLRLRALVQMDVSSSDSYFGIAVSSDGTHFITADASPVGGGYAEIYFCTVSAAGGGSIYTPFQIGSTQLALIEMNLLVTSSGIVVVTGVVNDTPVYGAGSFGSKTAFECTTVDLTTAFYFYATGANAGNMIAAAYSTSLF